MFCSNVCHVSSALKPMFCSNVCNLTSALKPMFCLFICFETHVLFDCMDSENISTTIPGRNVLTFITVEMAAHLLLLTYTYLFTMYIVL